MDRNYLAGQAGAPPMPSLVNAGYIFKCLLTMTPHLADYLLQCLQCLLANRTISRQCLSHFLNGRTRAFFDDVELLRVSCCENAPDF